MRPGTGSAPASVAELLSACTVALPLCALAALYSLAVRARIAVGDWPAPDRPDPKTLDVALHYDLVSWLMEAALASPVALAVLLLLARGAGAARVRAPAAFVTVFAATYAVFWLAFLGDPGQVFAWYCD